MDANIEASPFHKGEQALQSQYGVRDKLEQMGRSFIRDFMPEQHREFYQQLPYVFVGSIDPVGRPWASMILAQPGFMQTPNDTSLHIKSPRISGDPLNSNISVGSAIGILGIQLDARRRNRLSARVTSSNDTELNLAVVQAFGNCPQYIQSRELASGSNVISPVEKQPVSKFSRLSPRAKTIIENADSFYIATHHAEDGDAASYGADVSHRGGKPGFVRIDNDQALTFPDFTGNFHFNTLGNILLNPLAGLLFIDFDSGDLLYLSGGAEIIHDSEEKRAFEGAERLVRFELDEGILVKNALPSKWHFLEYSPSLDRTGSWAEVAETLSARRSTNVYRNYEVVRIDQESDAIRSFYLKPEADEAIHCHQAGQFLPLEIRLPGQETPIKRTYTISNAPNGEYYRLSIKREESPNDNYPPGWSSTYFHDQIKVGSRVCGLTPRGQFVLKENTMRSVVLLSAGVGITPMVSMLEALAQENATCGGDRKVWFIHGAINGQAHAFADHVDTLITDWSGTQAHYVYSRPSARDIRGRDYDSQGRINIELLKSILPLGDWNQDYEFYFCGPPAFMQSIYTGLKEIDVPDNCIHYEFFGPGVSLSNAGTDKNNGLVKALADQAPVDVRFEKSAMDVRWDPATGTLLEMAEQAGLKPQYSCRSGICGTCSVPILEGDVAYVDPPLADVQPGHALICCAYPEQQADAAEEPTQARMLKLDM